MVIFLRPPSPIWYSLGEDQIKCIKKNGTPNFIVKQTMFFGLHIARAMKWIGVLLTGNKFSREHSLFS